jgi:hypothetical protein
MPCYLLPVIVQTGNADIGDLNVIRRWKTSKHVWLCTGHAVFCDERLMAVIFVRMYAVTI